MDNGLKISITVGAIAFLLITVFIGGCMWGDSATCSSQSRRMGFPNEWDFPTNEYRPGQWIAMDKYHGADVQVNR